jgi:hypothetical protein
MTSSSVTSSKKSISVFKEDSVQIPTQRSRIPCFRPDDPVKRPDSHQLAISVQRGGVIPSGPPSMSRIFELFKVCIRPDVMANRPAALQSSRRIQCSTALVNLSKRLGYTVRKPSSVR